MTQLNDNRSRFYDGSVGGMHPLGDEHRPSATAEGRITYGYQSGKRDAKLIIDNLARDKNNNIVESIKIVTHSMGGAYGKGFVIALKEYIKTLPIEKQKQIKITLVADFDPFQGGDLNADPNIKTMQYIHENFWNMVGMGWLANEEEEGIDKRNVKRNTGSSTDHSIFTFFGDISTLKEGTYIWDNNSKGWILQR